MRPHWWPPSSAIGLDHCAQGCQCVAERSVSDSIDNNRFESPSRSLGVDGSRQRGFLHKTEAVHDALAQMRVDPLNQLSGEVLQLQCDRTGAAQCQRAGHEAPRRRGSSERRAYNGGPVRHQLRGRRPLFPERWPGDGGQHGADLARAERMAGRCGRLVLAGRVVSGHMAPMGDIAPDPVPAAALLLLWYDRHRRTMPWRATPGEAADPYRVWLSEIMLQQTTVAAVRPYFERFLARFPTVAALAAAPSDAVMEAWAGLGYYARARNMHACAQVVAAAGGFPKDLAGLRALPGIGPYTAAAVASIAFAVPVVPIDGNVERVVSRVFAIDKPLPGGKPMIATGAGRLGTDADARARPADFTQALFDLGATICTPRRPSCAVCPWREACRGRAGGDPERLPVKAPRRARPLRHGAHFWLQDAEDLVLLRRRPPEGLLGGMLELPGSEWRDRPWTKAEAEGAAPQPAAWKLIGQASHSFTHFELRLDIYAARVSTITAEGALHAVESLGTAALPSVMRRCIRIVLSDSPRLNLDAA